MKESYSKQRKRKEREERKFVAPSGRLMKDMPDWPVSALKASHEKKVESTTTGEEQKS